MKKFYSIKIVLSIIIATLIGCTDMIETTDTSRQEVSTRSVSTTDYYWYNGTKIGINKKPNKRFVLFKASDEQTVTSSRGGVKLTKQSQEVVLSSKIQKMNTKAASTEVLKWAVIEESVTTTRTASTLSEILYEAPYFLTESGEELGLSHLFYVKLNSDKDMSKLTELAASNMVQIVGNNEYMPLWYTLSCTTESSGNALELANKFYETNLFAACQPDLMGDIKPACVNDTYFSQQWNLNNTGQNGGTPRIDINYCNARNITQGANSVIVAVIDHGIQLNHPDLNVFPSSFDTETSTSPSMVRGPHGTACAGIIGAKANNNLGVAGIAPNCPLMSISNNLVSAPDYNQKIANGFNYAWQNGASVISNSWYSPYEQALLTDAISMALTSGRNGKGCVVAFATGNNNQNSVSYPANAIPDILAVGAISFCGERKNPASCDGESWGSNYGTALDIVAPGVYIPTTDLIGSSGYDFGDYYMRFNGTSSACPHVAATAALILSVNPNLTQKEVADIIEKTAKKVGDYSYIATTGRTNGTWNFDMGYGLLDAFLAVSMASGDIVYFNDRTVSASQFVAGWQIFSQNITVTNGAALTFSPGQQITINYPFTVDNGSLLTISY